jgi:hypothetical protein
VVTSVTMTFFTVSLSPHVARPYDIQTDPFARGTGHQSASIAHRFGVDRLPRPH